MPVRSHHLQGVTGSDAPSRYHAGGLKLIHRFTYIASEVTQPGPKATATLTPAATKTLTFTSGKGGLESNDISVSMSTAGDDTLAVTVSGNTINVAVAKTTGSNNSAAAIQAAIRNIAGGTVAGVDITGFTVTANAAYTSAPVTSATVAATALAGGDDTYFYLALKE